MITYEASFHPGYLSYVDKEKIYILIIKYTYINLKILKNYLNKQ